MKNDLLQDRRLMRQTITTKKVAIIGYGNQGRAQAKNLRDNGVAVIVGARESGASWKRAEKDHFSVLPVKEATQQTDIISLLLPDEIQAEVYKKDIGPHLRADQLLVFAHGFNLHYGLIEPPPDVDVSLIAPLGPGAILRENFLKGSAIPALLAVLQDHSKHAEIISLAYCWATGVARVGVFETTLKEETVTDLFAEQAVLCGGMIALARAAFETLVKAGYDEKTAYLTCVHEIQYTAKLLSEYGPAEMLSKISPTAAFGALTRGERVVPPETTTKAMKKMLAEIEKGTFAQELRKEGSTNWKALRLSIKRLAASPISKTASALGLRTREDAPS